MSIIEQLGGYDKAKEHRDYLISYGSEFGNVSIQEVDGLNDALLKHRRENNIFEVGDLIMYEGGLYEIKYIYHSEKARITDGFHGRYIYDFPKGIKHATPEEIKGGHRL